MVQVPHLAVWLEFVLSPWSCLICRSGDSFNYCGHLDMLWISQGNCFLNPSGSQWKCSNQGSWPIQEWTCHECVWQVALNALSWASCIWPHSLPIPGIPLRSAKSPKGITLESGSDLFSPSHFSSLASEHYIWVVLQCTLSLGTHCISLFASEHYIWMDLQCTLSLGTHCISSLASGCYIWMVLQCALSLDIHCISSFASEPYIWMILQCTLSLGIHCILSLASECYIWMVLQCTLSLGTHSISKVL